MGARWHLQGDGRDSTSQGPQSQVFPFDGLHGRYQSNQQAPHRSRRRAGNRQDTDTSLARFLAEAGRTADS
ncbi:MAG: hypothetical protein AVDCRST_MAG49-2169 [uncultured Thermomicrobiales bacterium]|uniref:Uncharacterized protein n=1 Tax=uncultured Thermomicrobiales bacterium TaxID=1645740 RepID=A0A6J4UR64_9BACT|nr:MAG: hypothetical protein AVDCRST_MAG49-2169 [uncultured Thermomicrobiales bacterium]